MKIEVKPSDIYRGVCPSMIEDYLLRCRFRVVTFRMVQDGDIVLFYNNKKLNIGVAKVQNAGYPRFIVESIIETKITDFWE